MAHLLGLLNRRVEELLLPVPARLARYLLALADEQLDLPEAVAAAAAHGPGGRRPALQPTTRVVKLPTSKRELAARLGTVPETLSRTFDRFKRAEVIRMSGDHELIEILSFDKLHRLAQDESGAARRRSGRLARRPAAQVRLWNASASRASTSSGSRPYSSNCSPNTGRSRTQSVPSAIGASER